MKTYEEFLEFLKEHLKEFIKIFPVNDEDFFPLVFAFARFLLSEPYRWNELIKDWPEIKRVNEDDEKNILEFFNKTKGMKLSFRKELMNRDLDTLKDAYSLFYPMIELRDNFLNSIFRLDIKSRRYKKIYRESSEKISRIIKKINQLKEDERIIPLIKKFTSDLSGFSLTLINNKNLLEQAIKDMM